MRVWCWWWWWRWHLLTTNRHSNDASLAQHASRPQAAQARRSQGKQGPQATVHCARQAGELYATNRQGATDLRRRSLCQHVCALVIQVKFEYSRDWGECTVAMRSWCCCITILLLCTFSYRYWVVGVSVSRCEKGTNGARLLSFALKTRGSLRRAVEHWLTLESKKCCANLLKCS